MVKQSDPTGKTASPKARLAILASGTGSNAACLFAYFDRHPQVEVVLLLTNNPHAPAIQKAFRAGIPCRVLTNVHWQDGEAPSALLEAHGVDYIALAGFLRKIPPDLIARYPRRILNIHPALLPGFGGQGMYGMHVHRAVLQAGETHSGISIHLVNAHYDEGEIIFQKKLKLARGESPESLAEKIQKLEHTHYPRVLEAYILAQKS